MMPEVPAFLIEGAPLKRLPTLAELSGTTVFLVSDHAGAMTGAVANMTCGAIVDLPRTDRV